MCKNQQKAEKTQVKYKFTSHRQYFTDLLEVVL